MNKLKLILKRALQAIILLSVIITLGLLGRTKYEEIQHGYIADHWYSPTLGILENDGYLFRIINTDNAFIVASYSDTGESLDVFVYWPIDTCTQGDTVTTSVKYGDGSPVKLTCVMSNATGAYALEYAVSHTLDYAYDTLHTSRYIDGFYFSLQESDLYGFAKKTQQAKLLKDLNNG